jgi:hypothetical protein
MGYAGRGGWCCKTSEVLARPNGRTDAPGGATPSSGTGLASAEVCEGNDRGANHEGGDKDGCEPARPATQFERLSL